MHVTTLEQLNSQFQDDLEKASLKGTENHEETSKAEIKEGIKQKMNTIYHALKAEFRPDRHYLGQEIHSQLYNIIKVKLQSSIIICSADSVQFSNFDYKVLSPLIDYCNYIGNFRMIKTLAKILRKARALALIKKRQFTISGLGSKMPSLFWPEQLVLLFQIV